LEPLPSKIKAVAKFVALSLNPAIRHDYFWWSDPVPGFIQMVRTIRWVGIKGFEKLGHRWRSRRFKRLWLAHQRRYEEGKYFRSLPRKVLFLCYGNIWRSAFAENLWNTRVRQYFPEGPMALSAGFHPTSDRKPHPWAVELAAEHSVNLNGHRSRIVTQSLVESADLIFLMDQRNYRDLIRKFPSAKDKTFFLGLFADNDRLEIGDPFGKSKPDARACYKHVAAATEGLINSVFKDQRPHACPRAVRDAQQLG
jgi:protein-tyrosine phosphatase